MAEAQPETITIQRGENRTLELGGLRFVARRQEVGEDGGHTIEVWGPVDGEDTQVLRFDCFRDAPHYHMPPSQPGARKLDRAEVGDPLEWALACARERLPEMVAKAGYAVLAGALDVAALAGGDAALRELIASCPEPSESFDVDAALVKE